MHFQGGLEYSFLHLHSLYEFTKMTNKSFNLILRPFLDFPTSISIKLYILHYFFYTYTHVLSDLKEALIDLSWIFTNAIPSFLKVVQCLKKQSDIFFKPFNLELIKWKYESFHSLPTNTISSLSIAGPRLFWVQMSRSVRSRIFTRYN